MFPGASDSLRPAVRVNTRDRQDDSRPRLPAGPIGKLPPQPWMTAPETHTLLKALQAGGAEVRFIGGCVRDSLLKRQRPAQDIDVALALPPDGVIELLRRASIKVVPTGIDHGTVTAVIGSMHYEITTLRVDVESYGRRARVAFTDDWVADAARRDFTFNALSCTPEGDIYDYFGGLEDLSGGRVRFVGDPQARIAEDVLRLLRFFRFYAWYGQPPADEDALVACRAWAAKVQTLSGERVRIELLRTLMAPDPADVFQLMRDWEVLEHVLPEADGIGRLRMLCWLDSRAVQIATVTADPIRRLAALLDTDAPGVAAIAERLRLSNHQRDRLQAIAARSEPVLPDAGPAVIRCLLYRRGRETVRDLALLSWAGELDSVPRLPRGRNEQWGALLHTIDEVPDVIFPLLGRDAIAAGVPAGPAVGAVLRQVEAWWEAGGCTAGRNACLARLQDQIHART